MSHRINRRLMTMLSKMKNLILFLKINRLIKAKIKKHMPWISKLTFKNYQNLTLKKLRWMMIKIITASREISTDTCQWNKILIQKIVNKNKMENSKMFITVFRDKMIANKRISNTKSIIIFKRKKILINNLL